MLWHFNLAENISTCISWDFYTNFAATFPIKNPTISLLSTCISWDFCHKLYQKTLEIRFWNCFLLRFSPIFAQLPLPAFCQMKFSILITLGQSGINAKFCWQRRATKKTLKMRLFFRNVLLSALGDFAFVTNDGQLNKALIASLR